MEQYTARVGRHVSTAGGISNSFINAKEVGCNTMQIFISSPRMWSVAPIDARQLDLFRRNSENYGIRPVFVHMPYLPNPASPEGIMHKKSVDTLVKISKMCDDIGIGYVIT